MSKEIQSFIDWTKKKVRLHFKPLVVYFKNREIWWASLGVSSKRLLRKIRVLPEEDFEKNIKLIKGLI